MKIPVYIGYDEKESGAFWTCAASILENASQPVEIIPLKRSTLPLTRAKHPKQSNEFAFTRFLVPYLQNFSGCAIFMDCDFLVLGDIADLWYLRDETKAVQVVQHDTSTFAAGKKYLGNEQTVYERKCWSSLMLFNCAHSDCMALHPDVIDLHEGLYLHQLKWARDEDIGALPKEWNWLVGHYEYNETQPKALHFTEGGPYFKQYADSDYAGVWWKYFDKMKYVQDGLT